MSAPISRFSGQYRFLSNFYPAQITFSFVFDGQRYRFAMPSVENAYQAAKIDPTILGYVAKVRSFADLTASEAKTAGRKVEMRPNWEDLKLPLMYAFLVQKFSHPNLRLLLQSTGTSELVEGNTWGDVWWGVDARTGIGENNLGKLLMRVRSEACL